VILFELVRAPTLDAERPGMPARNIEMRRHSAHALTIFGVPVG